MSWKVVWRALRISFGMMLGPGVFPLASFLRQLSNTYREKFSNIVEFWRALFLIKELCCVCRISCFMSIGFVSMLLVELV